MRLLGGSEAEEGEEKRLDQHLFLLFVGGRLDLLDVYFVPWVGLPNMEATHNLKARNS